MSLNISCLTCGYNGSGVSSLVTLEKVGKGTPSVVSRCLVNVGDGTQRFCSENRIKLSTVSCIVVNSLVPHCISGFPGIFLSLSDLVSYFVVLFAASNAISELKFLFSHIGCWKSDSNWTIRNKKLS
jgi:hypothetical protein